MAYIVGRSGQVPQPKANAGPAKKAKKARTIAVELPADISLKVSVADLARIGASPAPSAVTKAAAPARTVKPAKKKGGRVARKSKKGAKRWACWKCAGPMKKKGTFCKRCKKKQPQAVKAQTGMLTKSFGRAVKPVAVPVVKAAKPVCPNPACRARGGRTANACSRCGTPFTAVHAARAEKSARRMQLQIVQSAAWWEAQAARQHDPEAREQCRAAAQKALAARGHEGESAAAMIVKASGARTVREAWLRESDPAAREVRARRSTATGDGQRDEHDRGAPAARRHRRAAAADRCGGRAATGCDAARPDVRRGHAGGRSGDGSQSSGARRRQKAQGQDQGP